MTELDRRSSLEKITRRLRLRLDAQPQVIDTDGSHRGCVGRKSHQSRDLPPAQNSAMGFSRELSKKRSTVLDSFALKIQFVVLRRPGN